MFMLSPKQREIRERESLILDTARKLFVELGYYGVTMSSIADASDCPKGTIYQHFASKEDIIIALAAQYLEERLKMMRRAMAFQGRSRERIIALGEAVALFTRLRPDDSRILHIATGPIREKASPHRVAALHQIELDSAALLRTVLDEAVSSGDLPRQDEGFVEEITFGIWALIEGSFTLIESGAPLHVLDMHNPFSNMYRVFSVMADGYGWRPYTDEVDWEEVFARVRRTIFPDESQALYGEGCWYGDRG